jgi:hypothetical protein
VNKPLAWREAVTTPTPHYRGLDRLCVVVKPIIVKNPKRGPASGLIRFKAGPCWAVGLGMARWG